MAAPRRNNQLANQARRGNASQGYAASIYKEVMAPENQSVVRSFALFGAAVAFFASSWSEYLLPP
jgi:hypothetical protein